jgi:ubiquinone/menaquinone biosynthesis C-methylase UbiE
MEFSKDLSHITWDEVKKRQLQRFPLVKEWIRLTGMRKGHTVIDIGSGTGVFALEYAKTVGNEGKVYAIDRSQEALEYLRMELKQRHINHMITLNMNAEESLGDLDLPDIITITDVLHHSDSPKNILNNIHNISHATTKIMVSEFDAETKGEVGPPLKHRLHEQTLKDLTQEMGYEIISQGKQNFEHYYLLLQKEKK